MIDYSNQESNQRKGKHAVTIDLVNFKKFMLSISNLDFDYDFMVEIKDKEKSAKKAIGILNQINSNLYL